MALHQELVKNPAAGTGGGVISNDIIRPLARCSLTLFPVNPSKLGVCIGNIPTRLELDFSASSCLRLRFGKGLKLEISPFI